MIHLFFVIEKRDWNAHKKNKILNTLRLSFVVSLIWEFLLWDGDRIHKWKESPAAFRASTRWIGAFLSRFEFYLDQCAQRAPFGAAATSRISGKNTTK